MKNAHEALELLIWELRRAFRELADAADQHLLPLGIRAAERVFLEFLAREQDANSLSQLARKYSVSRQHIQQTLRRLPHPEWVEECADPADQRTILLRLSPQGKSIWKKIQAADREFLRRLAKRLPPGRVLAATAALRQLRSELDKTRKEISNEPSR